MRRVAGVRYPILPKPNTYTERRHVNAAGISEKDVRLTLGGLPFFGAGVSRGHSTEPNPRIRTDQVVGRDVGEGTREGLNLMICRNEFINRGTVSSRRSVTGGGGGSPWRHGSENRR